MNFAAERQAGKQVGADYVMIYRQASRELLAWHGFFKPESLLPWHTTFNKTPPPTRPQSPYSSQTVPLSGYEAIGYMSH